MSNINMQDILIKSSLVQQIQHRGEDVARVQAQSQVAANEEAAREADEVILELKQAENEGIREDGENKQPPPDRRRKRKKHRDGNDAGENDGDGPSASDGQHHIDITV